MYICLIDGGKEKKEKKKCVTQTNRDILFSSRGGFGFRAKTDRFRNFFFNSMQCPIKTNFFFFLLFFQSYQNSMHFIIIERVNLISALVLNPKYQYQSQVKDWME